MAGFVNICGPVVADTVYVDGKLVARDVAIKLPEVTPMTADIAVMGTFTIPIWQLIDHMEAEITKIGLDLGLKSMIKPETQQIECRWVQTVTDASGNTKNMGCKAFLKGIPNKIPEIGLEMGSASEHGVTLALTRYNLFADGQEIFLIDRFAGKVRISGKDYADLDSML